MMKPPMMQPLADADNYDGDDEFGRDAIDDL